VFPVRYELGFCMPEDGILHSNRRGNLKSYYLRFQFAVMSCAVSCCLRAVCNIKG
jgi:hypothetical protein